MNRLEEALKKRLRQSMRYVVDSDGEINYALLENMEILVRRGEREDLDLHAFRTAINFYRDYGFMFKKESETE